MARQERLYGYDMQSTDIGVQMVITVGLLIGTASGLLIGFAAGKQKPEWSFMTIREKQINIILVAACSTIAILALGWYFLWQ
jgi:hypothetical protein